MIIFSPSELVAILPELLVMTAACLVLVLDPVMSPTRKEWLAYLSLGSLGAALGIAYWFLWLPARSVFSGLYALDAYGTFWKLLLISVSAAIVLLAKANLKEEQIDLPE